MRSLCALSAGRRAIWLAAVALVLSVPAPAIAESGARDSGRQDGWSDKASRPDGWSAGSVASATGYHQRSGSQRVREVQRRLNRLGYRAGEVDGLFGPITAGAVRAFQAARDLAVDQVVGSRTLRELRSRTRQLTLLMRLGTGYDQPGGSVRVRKVQRRLNRLGYRAGKVDGLFGPITAAAVRAFQAARDLAVDGIVGRRTLRALRGRSVAAPTPREVPQRDTSQRETEQRRAPSAPTEDGLSLLWIALLFVAAVTAITALLAETLARLSGTARPRRSGATRSAPHANGQAVSGRWIGARIHLVGAQGAGPDTVYVEPELFAKSVDGSRETTLVRDRGRPLAIATDDFEDSLRDVFASEWLPRLEHALRTEGIEVSSSELESMPLVVELTADLRHTLAQHRWSPAGEEGGSDDA